MEGSTILIDDDKIVSKNEENEDIFETIFDEIKSTLNLNKEDGIQEDKIEEAQTKEEEKEDKKEEKEKGKEEKKKKNNEEVDGFEVLDEKYLEKEIKKEEENDSDKDDF